MFKTVFVLIFFVFSSFGIPIDSDEPKELEKLENNSTQHRDGKIIGGQDTEINTVPYQLSLEYMNRHTCGASILNERFALSAAHCVYGHNGSGFLIRAGTSVRQLGGSVHHIKTIIINKNYNPQIIDYDVSLLEVLDPFTFSSSVQPVSLSASEPYNGQTAVVSGWGSVDDGVVSISPKLQIVQIPILDKSQCAARYTGYGSVTERMICAGSPSHDSCQGDSGGPLVIGGQQVGIVSWGIGCGRGGYPGVYTNIGNPEIQQWITINSVSA